MPAARPGQTPANQVTAVDFHFDIMCPWAYQASIWMRDVRDQLGLQVRWRFFSLEEINRADGKKHPWEREWSYGWSMMRVGALLRRLDPELLDRWYHAAGSALHVYGRKPHRREVAEDLVSQLGLDPNLVGQAIGDAATSDEVRADHERVTSLGGWGVPTLVFGADRSAAEGSAGETALFGPVLIDPPTGDAAVRLWQLMTGWLEFPKLYEVQRPKQAGDLEAMATTFRPYLEARDWITIQKETP
jgi:2-hydroxychromene-2-carboxylate isomerase